MPGHTRVRSDSRSGVFTEVNGFEQTWGSDPARKIVAIEDVVRIVDSPVRLPADLANQIYEAGESGIGYVIFTAICVTVARSHT